jgi:hypothetical protein
VIRPTMEGRYLAACCEELHFKVVLIVTGEKK